MVRFVEHKNIDKQKWDDCIDRSSNNSVSAYSWYLDVVCKNWSALVLDDYQAVFPIPVKSKFGIKYLLQPLFMRCVGIYSKTEPTEELVNIFFDAIPSNIKLIQLYLKENTPFQRPDYAITKRTVQIAKIDQPYEIVKQSYSDSVFKNLRKAELHNITIIDNVSPEQIAALHQKYVGGPVAKLSSAQSKVIENLMIAAIKNKCGIPIGVINTKNELIAAAFFMRSKNAIFYSFGSANPEGKSAGASSLMIDEIIKRYSGQVELFDFEGSEMEGIAKFNNFFGAKNFVYLHIKKNTLPRIVKLISRKK